MLTPTAHLKAARKTAQLTQPQAAAFCGVSFSAWEKWERGVNPISPPTLAGCLLLLGETPALAREAALRLIAADAP